MSVLIERPGVASRNQSVAGAAGPENKAELSPSRWGRVPLLLLIGAALYYGVAAYRITISKEPFIDEGWFASPAYNLAFHGYMGTSVLEPTGSWLQGNLKGIQQYTYWVMPLDILAQAAWYRLFGFGLAQMRVLSVLWGIVVLTAWYFIVERIARNRLAASLAVFLLSLDFTFLWSAADGRMDMMCVGLGSAALAFYLMNREKNFTLAFLGANCLTAASIFTHPNGVAWTLFLFLLVGLYDRRRFEPRHLFAAVPYAVLAAGWAAYIARRPDDFLAQFAANSHIPGFGTRGANFAHPLNAFYREFVRYQDHFGHGLWAYPVPSYGIWIPILFVALWMVAIAHYLRTREKPLGVFILLTAACFLLMTFGDVTKTPNYLSMIIPLYLATAAVWFCRHQFRGPWFLVRCLPLLLLLGLQVTILQTKLLDDPLKEDFGPTVAFLKSMPHARVTADAAFAFGLGYDRLDDDARLGMYSGRKPDLIVGDKWYFFDWWQVFRLHDPQAESFVNHLLKQDYHRVFADGWYVVYQRNDYVGASAAENSPQVTPVRNEKSVGN